MSDVQLLFVVLGVLYVWECLTWVRRGSVAVGTWRGRRWRLHHPNVMFGNATGGFTLAQPFPPLGQFFVASQLPFSLGPDGVLWFVSTTVNPGWRPAQSGRFLTWTEVSRLKLRGKKLLLDQRKIWTAPNQPRAEYIFQSLLELARATQEQRPTAIKNFFQTTMDSQQIETLRHEFSARGRLLRRLTNWGFGLIFLVAPALAALVGFKLIWIGLLLAWLGLAIPIAILFAREHRKFYPAAADERFTQTLIIALAPATTLRAHDFLSRPLLEKFHPLAVAQQLLAPQHFHPFARRLLQDLRHPALPHCPDSLPAAAAVEIFSRRAQLEVTETWLRERGITPEELCHPPAPGDESCRAYCPRCEAQFTNVAGRCADCGGVALVAFPKVS